MELSGKVAIITGGAGGLGTCIAKSLLQSGVTVVLFDMNKDKGEDLKRKFEQEYGKGKVHFVSGSVTKKEDIEGLFKETVDKFSRVDIVLNNAGIMNDEFWEAEIEINLRGVVLGTQEALKYMSKQNGGKGGVILNTASILGLIPFHLTPVYNATKHAVIGFTRSYCFPQIYEMSGVRVIAMCPGLTQTDLVNKGSFGDLFQKFRSKHPNQDKLYPVQQPEAVGSEIPKLLREAPNGSIWVVEGGKPAYQVFIPHYEKLTVPDDGQRLGQ